MRIEGILIESFRGFGQPFEFNFSGIDILLIHGPNGHGKTSFFDAIEWALTGRILRYDSEQTAERKQYRYIGNAFYPDRKPKVKVWLRIADGSVLEVIRTGIAEPGDQTDCEADQLQLRINGVEVEKGQFLRINGVEEEVDELQSTLDNFLINEDWRGRVNPSEGLFLTHFLSQERINRFFRGVKETERYKSVSLMFGTEHFNQYRIYAQRAKLILEQEIEQVKQQSSRNQDLLTQTDKNLSEVTSRLAGAVDDKGMSTESGISAESKLFDLIARYAKHFGHSLELSEPPIRFQEIEVEVRKDQLQLTYRWEKLNEEWIYLLRAHRAFEEWRNIFSNYTTIEKNIGLYEQLDLIYKQTQLIHWLIERLPEYQSTDVHRQNIQREHYSIMQEFEKHRDSAQSLRLIIEHVKEHLLLAKIDNTKYATFLVDMAEHPIILDWPKRGQLLRLLQSLKEVYSLVAKNKVAEEDVLKQVEHYQVLINQLTGTANKYHELLRIVEEFVRENVEIKNCPACGSPKQSSELLSHLREEQSDGFSRFPELEQWNSHLQREKELAEQTSKSLLTNIQHMKTAVEDIESYIDALEQEASSHYKESISFRSRAVEKSKELAGINDVQQEYIEKLYSLELEPNLKDLSYVLNKEKEKLNLKWTELSALLSLEETSDWRYEWEKTKQQLRVCQNVANNLVDCMRQLDIKQPEELVWRISEAQEILNSYQTQHDYQKQALEISQSLLRQISHLLSFTLDWKNYVFLRKESQDLSLSIKKAKVLQSNLNKKIDLLREISKQVPEALKRLNEAVIDDLFETMRTIFVRINSHPVFRDIVYDTTKRRNVNHLFLKVLTGADDEVDAEFNPSYIFSAAQINSIAVSFFLAMALKQQWSPLQLIGMDDPVQSMDDLNVLALIDLIRMLVDQNNGENKQFIISTHDPTFYELMIRKFRFLKLGVVEYEGYSEQGPSVIKRVINPIEPRYDLLTTAWEE